MFVKVFFTLFVLILCKYILIKNKTQKKLAQVAQKRMTYFASLSFFHLININAVLLLSYFYVSLFCHLGDSGAINLHYSMKIPSSTQSKYFMCCCLRAP